MRETYYIRCFDKIVPQGTPGAYLQESNDGEVITSRFCITMYECEASYGANVTAHASGKTPEEARAKCEALVRVADSDDCQGDY
jgi:hypothetical protein